MIRVGSSQFMTSTEGTAAPNHLDASFVYLHSMYE